MKDIQVSADYKGHSLITGDYGEYEYNKRHLANNLELMKSMTQRHDKVYSYRMNLHMPKDIKLDKTPKQLACSFMSAYCKKLARQKIDSEYIMKMEKDTSSNNPNFRIQMFVDGSKVKGRSELIAKGKELLADQLGLPKDNNGLLESSECTEAAPKNNGIMIRRNSNKFDEQFDNCFKQVSYLCKQKPTDQVKSSERKVFYSKYRNGKSRSSK